jgi:hypothetical protein
MRRHENLPPYMCPGSHAERRRGHRRSGLLPVAAPDASLSARQATEPKALAAVSPPTAPVTARPRNAAGLSLAQIGLSAIHGTRIRSPGGQPYELLAAVRDLTRRVRVAQRGTWFPLLVFATITLVAIPVYRYAPYLDLFGTCRSRPQYTVCMAPLSTRCIRQSRTPDHVARQRAYAANSAFSALPLSRSNV